MTIAPQLENLAPADGLQQAIRWGLAIRLGQRLSGGVAGPLQLGALEQEGNVLRLTLANQHQALFGEAVERRLRQLAGAMRSEEHTSELQSLMRISYAVFCLKKKKTKNKTK